MPWPPRCWSWPPWATVRWRPRSPWAPAQAVGQVSYGLYLWHWPVLVFLTPVRAGYDGLALLALRIGVTAVAAAGSYFFIERPIRHRRWPTPVLRLAASGVALGLAAAFAVLASQAAPLPQYLASSNLSSTHRRVPEVVRPKASATLPPQATVPGVVPAVLPKIAVLEGDSVAASLEDPLAAELARRGVVAVKSAVNGCGMITGAPLDPDGQPYPFANACSDEIPGRQLGDITRFGPQLVVWVSTWEGRARAVYGVKAELGTPSGDETILGLMREAVGRLSLRGARVMVVTLPVPYDTATVTHPAGLIRSIPRMNALLRRLAQADPAHVGLVDLGAIACGPGPGCPHVRDGVEVRSDGLHYSAAGAALVAPALVDRLLDPDQWQTSVRSNAVPG